MSKCTRSLSLILTLILSFSLFSVNAFATDVNNLSNDINFRFFSLDDYPGIPKQYGHTPYVTNNDLPLSFEYDLYNLFNKFPDGNFVHYDIFDFAYINSNKINTTELYNGDKIILNKGENFKASVSVVGSYFLAKNSTGYICNQFPLYQNNSYKVYFDLYDGSGNSISVDAEDFEINFKEYNNGNVGTAAYYNISASFSDVPFDVYGIRLITVSNAIDSFGGNLASDFNAQYYKTDVLNGNVDIFRYVNVDSFALVVDDSNKNLLNSIISWLSNIKENLTSGLSNVSNGLTNLGNRINTFFSNLGSTITTNFNSLTTNFKNNITSLGDRFSGFITSLGDRISGFFENLSVNISGFFSDLLDGIKEFFKGFGNLILYFNWEGEYTNPFESSNSIIGNGSADDTGSSDDTSSDVSVQGALDNILEYLSTVTTDIENVMDSITGSIKLFSDFCDEFPFIKALCIFVLALIIYSTVIGL